MFESVTWDDLWGYGIFKAGFSHPPGGPAFNRTSVYAFHHYTPPNVGSVDSYVAARVKEARALLSKCLITVSSPTYLTLNPLVSHPLPGVPLVTEFTVGGEEEMAVFDSHLLVT